MAAREHLHEAPSHLQGVLQVVIGRVDRLIVHVATGKHRFYIGKKTRKQGVATAWKHARKNRTGGFCHRDGAFRIDRGEHNCGISWTGPNLFQVQSPCE